MLCGVILVVMFVTCVTACGLVAYLLFNGINKHVGCRHYAHTLLPEYEHDDSTRNHVKTSKTITRASNHAPHSPVGTDPPNNSNETLSPIKAQATSGRS